MAGLFFLLAAGMNLLLAAGQLNLGHTAFFGIGAYASGLLALHFGLSPLLTMPLAAAFTALVGVAAGPAHPEAARRLLRARHHGLRRGDPARRHQLDGSDAGADGPGRRAAVRSRHRAVDARQSKRDYYYFMAVLAAGTLYLTARLLGSRVGRALAAIRSNEGLAESSGISAYRHTMLAMVVACGLAGVAGAFYAHYITFLSPELFGFQNTVTMAVMVVAGGQGMVLGPAVGALVFTFVPELLRMAAFYRMLLYGVILLLVVMFMPQGPRALLPPARGRAHPGCRA